MQIRGAAEAARELPSPDQLVDRATGEAVTDHASSWVRRVATERGDCYVKVYEYATWARRLGNFARHTGPLMDSRGRREFAALRWLLAAGLPAADPLAVFEARTCGFLTKAVLVTRAWPGQPLDRLLPTLAAADRERLAAALGHFVATVHDLGLRDRNLDLRNLLARPRDDGWEVTKIDSPRHCIVRAGDRDDALRRADWARLLPQLAAFDLAEITLRAAAGGSRSALPLRVPGPDRADRR